MYAQPSAKFYMPSPVQGVGGNVFYQGYNSVKGNQQEGRTVKILAPNSITPDFCTSLGGGWYRVNSN